MPQHPNNPSAGSKNVVQNSLFASGGSNIKIFPDTCFLNILQSRANHYAPSIQILFRLLCKRYRILYSLFEGDDLAMRTRVFIAHLSGERQMYGPNKKTAQRHRELRLKMLLGA